MILALDFGQKMGWAVYYGPDDVLYGTEIFKPGRHEGGGMVWVRLRSWLRHMHDDHGPIDRVYYEEVRRHKGTDAAHYYGGFLAGVTGWCERQNVPYLGVPVQHIKMFATGRGNASKEQVKDAMRKRGYEPADDNQADALALMTLAVERWVK
jgi:Holliday junction resolvasome RuvABC endonuclease subunit